MRRFIWGCLLLLSALMFAACGNDNDDDDNGNGLRITTGSTLTAATVGAAYNQTLAASGGTSPYTWALATGSSLPAGLSLSTAGVLSGTPTTAATSSFAISVTDSATPANTTTKTFTLTVAAPTALTITTTSPLNAGTVGTALSQTLTASGGISPYSWAVSTGSLPAGLSLSTGGVLSGTPTTEGTSTFTISVTDSATPANTASKSFSLTVAAAGSPLTITTSSLPAATFGTNYASTNLAATGGTVPYTWALATGSAALPRGMSLSSAGALSGQPLASGTFNITVSATDSASPATTVTKNLTLTVNISATVASGKSIYDSRCTGCHAVGVYDTSGGPDLGGVSLSTLNGRFGGGSSHNGNTLTSTQINDMFAFTSLF